MYEDISGSTDVTEWSKSKVELAGYAKSTSIDDVEIPEGYAHSISWDFIITNKFGTTLRAGTIRTVLNGGYQISSAVPHSVVEATPVGYFTKNVLVSVVSAESGQVSFNVASHHAESMFITFAAKKISSLLETEVPKIQLTISGLTGFDTFNGMGNGVHILNPHYYKRIGMTEYGSYMDSYFGSESSIGSSTELEHWRHGDVPYNGTTENAGHIAFISKETSTSATSYVNLYWVNGGSTTGTSIYYYSSGTAKPNYGALRDQILTGSWTGNGVTIQWQRAPGQTGMWENY